jgi:hypothetical protein
MKKTIYKIGLVPIIIILTIGLFSAVPAMAGDVETLSIGEAGVVAPDTVANDGNGQLGFWWNCRDWDSPRIATYYTFSIHELTPGTPPTLGPVIYIQYSDGQGTDTFPTGSISHTLQAVYGSEGDENVRQPAYTGPDDEDNPHVFTVPEGFTPGQYQAQVYVYLDNDSIVPAGVPFYVEQATGNLTVEKDDGGAGESWDFYIYGPDDPNSLYGSHAVIGGDSYTFEDIPIGEYVVVEDLKANWVCLDQDGTPPDAVATVPLNDEVSVLFTNQQSVGSLEIQKTTDPSGSESGWTFTITQTTGGSYTDSKTTGGTGIVTFSGIPTGAYTVTETLDSDWICTDIYESGVGYDVSPGDGEIEGVSVAIGETAYVDFYNEQKGSLTIYKYEDAEPYDHWDGESLLNGYNFYFSVDGSGNYNTSSGGSVIVSGLIPGDHTVVEETLPPNWICTDSDYTKVVTVPAGGNVDVYFGNRHVERKVPTLSQWGIIGLSAVFVALLVWFGMRRRRIA